jgi:hypothetical protein
MSRQTYWLKRQEPPVGDMTGSRDIAGLSQKRSLVHDELLKTIVTFRGVIITMTKACPSLSIDCQAGVSD